MATPTKADCAEPICSSKKDAMRSMFSKAGPKSTNATSTNATSTTSSAAVAAAVFACPPDREELGHHSWTLLHTLAAYYPEKPTDAQSNAARGFISGLATLYPCSHCAEEFRGGISESPPRVESREALSVWMCQAPLPLVAISMCPAQRKGRAPCSLRRCP